MVRLALALGEGSELSDKRTLVGMDRRTSEHAFARLNETVLVYHYVEDVLLDFVGSGRVSGINLSPEGLRLATLDPFTIFTSQVFGEAELGVPGARRMLEVSERRFSEILGLAQLSTDAKAAEVRRRFMGSPDAPTLDTYLAVHDQVLRAWNYRCAITGAQFAPGARPHPQLRVVAIRPRDQGGPLHVNNYLPMVEAAERSWVTGAIAASAEFEMLVWLKPIDPSLLSAIELSKTLFLPSEPANWPDPDLLAWHRTNVFGRG